MGRSLDITRRRFANDDPYEGIEWTKHHVRIDGPTGVVFEQYGVEAPAEWSETAVKITASKYFRINPTTGKKESSVRELIDRVVGAITTAGREQGYFDATLAGDFEADLKWLLVRQYFQFNSPVLFNVGIDPHPQASACFILGIEDSMDSILQTIQTEGMLFKHGSGSGTNVSTLRSSKERLSGGGKASGPVSFMRGFDGIAGIIKSGGRSRRAAVLRAMDVSHPDIREFIGCKAHEEDKAQALIAAGYDGSVGGEAYSTVAHQNANHSVRIPDLFMNRWREDKDWQLEAVKTGKLVECVPCDDILTQIAECAWKCGDPGIQFHDAANRMNTCAADGEIVCSNPCGEYLFLNDSACNLASLNLMKFERNGTFNSDGFIDAIKIIITAQDILCSTASYPNEQIALNTHEYRPLGLGYANLGALLMSRGVPYHSRDGRLIAASITALMTAAAYQQSLNIARILGAYPAFDRNRKYHGAVLNKHLTACERPETEFQAAKGLMRSVCAQVASGATLRNAQVTVIAPTGTIGFAMDCDSTGIEPVMALEQTKRTIDGSTIRIVPKCVQQGMAALGYGADEPLAGDEAVFATAYGDNAISPEGHLLMMAAVQPLLSGGISKTVALPKSASVEDVKRVFVRAWELGLKSITVYRDGSKGAQPINVAPTTPTAITQESQEPLPSPVRKRLPETRNAINHKFEIGGTEGYVTVGLYDDGKPGELFVTVSKAGSTISGMMSAYGIAFSMALQHGVPLKTLVEKMKHMRFDPAGYTPNSDIRFADSIIDYIARWLELRFLTHDNEPVAEVKPLAPMRGGEADGPPCTVCGGITQRAGTCHVCPVCGTTSGCS